MKSTSKKLKILYVGNFARLSVGEPEIAKSLQELGHEVDCVGEGEKSYLELQKMIEGGNYDFLLFAKFRIIPSSSIEEFVKELKIPSVCWLFDLYFSL